VGLAAVGATLASADARAETIRARFRAHGVEPPATLSRELDAPIVQSVTSEEGGDLLVVATLDRPVRWVVALFERKGARWRAETLAWDAARTLPAATGAGLEGCGTPMDVRHTPDGFRVDTHINPSAACTIFLSPELRPRAVIDGWMLRELPGSRFIYQHSQIHFAATHPLELRLFDAQRLTDTPVHPAKPSQPIRAGFVSRLWWTYTPQWCQPRNHPCDPERPSERMEGDLAVSPGGDALAFLTTLEEDLVPPVQAMYVYRGLGAGQTLEFREIGVPDFRARFGTVSPERALEPETLGQIFAR
jgi:hypothetical protein